LNAVAFPQGKMFIEIQLHFGWSAVCDNEAF
jgi:hypothetical protein